MVNKFANTKQTDDNKKRKICKHIKKFVNTAISMLTFQIECFTIWKEKSTNVIWILKYDIISEFIFEL